MNKMNSNFTFLDDAFPELANLGKQAESYLYSDTDACSNKLGTLVETIFNYIIDFNKIQLSVLDNNLSSKNRQLHLKGILPDRIFLNINIIRYQRNIGSHAGRNVLIESCKAILKMAYNISIWFMQTYGDTNYIPSDFVLPKEGEPYDDIAKNEEQIEKFKDEKVTDITKNIDINVDPAERINRSNKSIINRFQKKVLALLLVTNFVKLVGKLTHKTFVMQKAQDWKSY